VTHRSLDCVIPARDEASTVAGSVAAALGCDRVREVIVVDDGSTDETADRAASAGAKVIRLAASSGSKAHAMRAGADASDAELLLFVDADCLGLRTAHLDAIVEPVVDGRAGLSIGMFDYGPIWNPLVLRWPPLSGERCLSRSLFDAVPADKLDGYTIEVRINEAACAAGLPIVTRTMRAVTHRTKRQKFGTVEGMRRTFGMYRDLVGLVRPFGDIPPSAYRTYLRLLTVAPPCG
jgi:glycosyltransferase involved in cell wall biosynthesis